MKADVQTLEAEKAGTVDLADHIFGLEPRADILHRMVQWQLAKRQAGTHKSKGRSEINRTKKKVYKQKGTGNARHGSRRPGIFIGGGKAFGPVVRSHAIRSAQAGPGSGAPACAVLQGQGLGDHRDRQDRT